MFKSYKVVLGIASLLISGCMTYHQTDLPKEQVATLKDYFRLHIDTHILAVDGTTINNEYFRRLKNKVILEPGEHTIRVQINYRFPPGNETTDHAVVSFKAEAGHEYQIKVRFTGITTRYCWIEDLTTGKRFEGEGTLDRFEDRTPVNIKAEKQKKRKTASDPFLDRTPVR